MTLKTTISIMAASAMLTLGTSCTAQVIKPPEDKTSANDKIMTILPGDKKFKTPDFENYEAIYNSAMGKNGRFSLQARKSGNGKTIFLIDTIPMKDNIIIAQRVMDAKTHKTKFYAGPYFAWGKEYVVRQSTDDSYDLSRVPLGGGEVAHTTGKLVNGGGVDVMFSPTLAALMPMDIGTAFKMPAVYPRKGGLVSSEFDDYRVLRREKLNLDSGVSCDCWVIEKTAWGDGSKTQYWVSREAPFIYRRHRDVGGKRDFVSDVQSYRVMK